MRAVIIPKEQAYLYTEYIYLENWKAIQAIELKDGTFFIDEEIYKTLPENLQVSRTDPKSKEEVTISVKEELAKFPVKTLKISDYKIAEAISEEIIKK